ncbi:MAG: hypothetical protein LBH43_05760 [Treponema sp.]|jgi:hypothetical protein|nr:hypothetical protein [Treponema sp.]
MKNTIKIFAIIALVAVFGFSFTGCGTIMKTKVVTVQSASGATPDVRIEQFGINLYSGPLPARIDVKGLSQINPMASINVHYTDKDGNPAVFEITKTFNFWFIGSIGTTVFWIVDVVTGSLFTYNFSKTVVPIGYDSQPEGDFWLFEGIPPQMMENLTFVGYMD